MPNMHELMTEKVKLHIDKEMLEKELNAVKAAIYEIDEQLMGSMDDAGLMQIADGDMTIYISEMIVPTVIDWDLAHRFILNNDAMHLMEQRMSARAWRESEESGIHIPGTEAFTKRTIKRRKK